MRSSPEEFQLLVAGVQPPAANDTTPSRGAPIYIFPINKTICYTYIRGQLLGL
jgi:hypothetical protein